MKYSFIQHLRLYLNEKSKPFIFICYQQNFIKYNIVQILKNNYNYYKQLFYRNSAGLKAREKSACLIFFGFANFDSSSLTIDVGSSANAIQF